MNSKEVMQNLINENHMFGAPMAGVTDSVFRNMVRKFHDGVLFSEMVSVDGLSRGVKKSIRYVFTKKEEAPVFLQLFGSNPQLFSDTVKLLDGMESYHTGYDVNMGCPVKKVTNKNAGSALLQDLPRIQAIVKSLRSSTEKPITIKIRLGWDLNSLVANEVVKIAYNEGVDAIIIHARTRADMFMGTPRYELLGEVIAKNKGTIPIIANGDIVDEESYKKMMSLGANGVMIGRAMMSTPWIFRTLRTGEDINKMVTGLQIYDIMLEMIEGYKNLSKVQKTKFNIEFVKKFAVKFSKGYHEATLFRNLVYDKDTCDEKRFYELMHEFYVVRNPGGPKYPIGLSG